MTTTTSLKCSETMSSAWRGRACPRDAVAIKVTVTGEYQPRCRMHLSVEQRRAARYAFSPPKTVALDDAAALAWLAERKAQAEAAAAQKRNAEDEHQAQVKAEMLVSEHAERVQSWTMTRDDEQDLWDKSAPAQPRWTWAPEGDQQPARRLFGSREVKLKRAYPGDERFPMFLEVRVSSTMTSNEARALAQALIVAAAEADKQPGSQEG